MEVSDRMSFCTKQKIYYLMLKLEKTKRATLQANLQVLWTELVAVHVDG